MGPCTVLGRLVLQSDGKLVAAGFVTGQGNNLYDLSISRYSANGQRDTGSAGKAPSSPNDGDVDNLYDENDIDWALSHPSGTMDTVSSSEQTTNI